MLTLSSTIPWKKHHFYSHKAAKVLFITTLLLQISSITFAQWGSDFERIFDKEMQKNELKPDTPIFRNISQLSYLPDTLPTWYFQLPKSEADFTYSIGISDPDQPIDQAIEQAIHRAQTKAILLNQMRIEYFRDFYASSQNPESSSKQRERFDTYFRINSQSNANNSQFQVVNQHLTRYNEAVVLLRYTPIPSAPVDSSGLQTNIQGTILYIEAQLDELFEPQAEYTLRSSQVVGDLLSKSSHFQFIQKGNRSLSVSEYLGAPNEFPLFPYRYSTPMLEENSTPLVSYNGLWSMHIKDFLRQLCLTTERSSVRMRSLSEGYTSETTNLSRETASFDVKIGINGIVFGKDSIEFILDKSDIKN